MMNKIFEFIEAKKIFNLKNEDVSIMIHPLSFIHAIVFFKGNLVKLLAHDTNLNIPISNSLGIHSDYKGKAVKNLFTKLNKLKFTQPKEKDFPLLSIIKYIPEKTSYFETILTTLNDELVKKYLDGNINYISLIKNIIYFIKCPYFKKYYKLKPKNIYDINKITEVTKKYLFLKLNIMKNKIFFINKIIIFILISLTISLNAKSEIIKKIEIYGNERVSDQTIVIFSNLKVGDDIKTNDLNISLKEIYNTNYFEDVKMSFEDGILKINVKENPIIQSVLINGIEKNNIYEKIQEVTSKIEKYPFIKNQVNEQVILLKNILKSYGVYFVVLDGSINANNNNTVDLIYNFDLGEVAKISKINFIGNKVFRDSTLRNVIISEDQVLEIHNAK